MKSNSDLPNLFALYSNVGEESLKESLEGLTLDKLKAACREYALDPTGQYRRMNDRDKLVSFIVSRIKDIFNRGKVFL